MAAVSAVERTEGKRAWKRIGSRGYRRVWLVTTDDPTDGPAVARGHASIPALGAGFPTDSDAEVIRVDPQPYMDRIHFLVVVDYETPTERTPEEDPRDETPIIAWDFIEQEVVVEKDKDGNAVLNSARDPFDPPATETAYLLRFTAQRNEDLADYDPGDAWVMQGSTNSVPYLLTNKTILTRQSLLTRYSGARRTRNAITYWDVNYEIVIVDDNWDLELLDQGLFQRSGTRKSRILVDGQDAEQPQRLDGSGVALAPTAAPSASVFGTWRVKKEKDFSVLNLAGI